MGGKKGERVAPDMGDMGKRRRNGETRETRGIGPGHSAHPLTERRRARAVRPADSRDSAPETTSHRQDRSPWPCARPPLGPAGSLPLTGAAAAGAAPPPAQGPGGGTGRAARDRDRRAALARHRPAPPRAAANHKAPSLPPPPASQWERAAPQRHAHPSLWAEGPRVFPVFPGSRFLPVFRCSRCSRCSGPCRCSMFPVFRCSRCPGPSRCGFMSEYVGSTCLPACSHSSRC